MTRYLPHKHLSYFKPFADSYALEKHDYFSYIDVAINYIFTAKYILLLIYIPSWGKDVFYSTDGKI